MIVVGVDGSECSHAALRFALKEAQIRDAKLRLVVVWHVPLAAYGAGWAPPPPHLSEDSQAAAQDVLSEAMEIVGAEIGEIEVEPVIREGQPARVLVDESTDVEMLIVGSRGHGGFRELMLGSVSQQCAHHARCPVVIVRPGCENAPGEEHTAKALEN